MLCFRYRLKRSIRRQTHRMPESNGGITNKSHGDDQQPSSTTPRRGRSVRILGWFGAVCLRVLHATWRVEDEGLARLDQMATEGERVLVTFWHGEYLPLFTMLRGRRGCVFTSHSFRGAVIRDICQRFGYECVQLPDDGGVKSLALMRRTLAAYVLGGVAVDGPLGPHHVVKPGVVVLASRADLVLMPMSTAGRHSWVLNRRWDRMALPILFTRVALVVGEPIRVPPKLDRQAISDWEDRVHQALDAVDQRAKTIVNRE